MKSEKYRGKYLQLKIHFTCIGEKGWLLLLFFGSLLTGVPDLPGGKRSGTNQPVNTRLLSSYHKRRLPRIRLPGAHGTGQRVEREPDLLVDRAKA